MENLVLGHWRKNLEQRRGLRTAEVEQRFVAVVTKALKLLIVMLEEGC